VVVLDLSGVFDLEYSALKMLIAAEKRQRAAGVSLWLAGVPPDVYGIVQRSGLGETLGRERLAHNLEIAVERYLTTPSPGASHA
jgi:anti-anti-sigma regulatory factor